jgi:uncharacterized membrane protein
MNFVLFLLCLTVYVFSLMLVVHFFMENNISPNILTFLLVFLPIVNTIYLCHVMREEGTFKERIKRHWDELKNLERKMKNDS